MAMGTMEKMSESRLLGYTEAANYLATTPRTVQRLIARGVLRSVRIPGVRRVFVDKRDLDTMIDSGKGEA
jgi:excisionase family DNA binding protein